MILLPLSFIFFFFNDTATTEIYTLSLHDALPISSTSPRDGFTKRYFCADKSYLQYLVSQLPLDKKGADRKSTRLNSSHLVISYAVFCLKKKKKIKRRLCTASSTAQGGTAHS